MARLGGIGVVNSVSVPNKAALWMSAVGFRGRSANVTRYHLWRTTAKPSLLTLR